MEAPKKIWLDLASPDVCKHWTSVGTPYIRADLVDELMGVVEQELKWIDAGEEPRPSDEWHNKMKLALAKIKEGE